FQKKVIKIEEDRRTALGSTPLYSGKYNEKGREKAEYVEDTGEKDGRRPPRSAAFQGVMMNDVM
ncbi:MAG: hypothetical protein MMC23_008108, partial [Stictis urceolatum]|nr:hypothetical protein [Stictis urceolata]